MSFNGTITHILYFIFVLININILKAQEEIPVQILGPENGLSQSSVLSIHQDSMGFIWIGTRDGLNEYNGNSIKIKRNIIGDSLSIAGNIINDIKDDSDGNIWVAHNEGISLYNRTDGLFKNYVVGRSSNREMRSVSIIDNILWTTGWTGIYIYDSDNDLFVQPNINVDDNIDVLDASVSKIIKSPNENVFWIATTTRGLFRYDVERNLMTRVRRNSENGLYISENERIEDIVFHPNGKLYVATYNNGLYECNTSGKPLKQWNSDQSGIYYTSFSNIRSLAIDKDGNVWIGSFKGLGRLDPESDAIYTVSMVEAERTVDSSSIRSLLIDDNGSLWVGTYYEGLMLYDEYLTRFTAHYLLKDNTTSHNIISAFTNIDNRLIVATENGKVIEYNDDNKIVRVTELKNSQGDFVVIKSLYYDDISATMLVGTLRDGLFSIKNNLVRELGYTELGGINNLIKESDDYIWILSDKFNGINIYNLRSNSLESYTVANKLHSLVGKNAVKHLNKLTSGTYLLSTAGAGLIKFNNTGVGQAERIIEGINDINHTLIKNDTIIVSTSTNGIYLLNDMFNIISHLTTSDGLLHNSVLSVIPGNNEYWITYLNGISQWIPGNDIINYNIRNGFPLSEIYKSFYVQSDSNDSSPMVVVGGKNAWVSFNPIDVFKNHYQPAVYLSNFYINNTPVSEIEAFKDIDFHQLQNIKLKYNQTAITLEFAGLNYIMPDNNTFRYKLEHLDSNWKYTDNLGRIEYSTIPRGKYRLLVQASNNDGVWSEELVIPLSVSPPWWYSWQAMFCYFLILVSITLFVRNNALRKASLEHRIYLKEVEKRQLEQIHNLKVKYFTDISHEIRTPLMLILSPIEEMIESSDFDNDLKQKLINIQYQGASMLKLVNQLLEINRVELKKEKLQPKPLNLQIFVDNIYHSFSFISNKNNIFWTTNLTGLKEVNLLLDKDKMEKILLNLLSNAFKYSKENGTVKLTMSSLPDGNDTVKLVISVFDNGIGIPNEDLPFIFDRFYKSNNKIMSTGSGIGLSLVKAIVENLMNGTIKSESTVGEGSIFTVSIPHVPVVKYEFADNAETTVVPSNDMLELTRTEESMYVAEKLNNKKSILIVEDNIALLNLLSEKLNKQYNIFNVTSAEDAGKVLEDENVDVVVSDIILPGKSGTEFCAEIKSNILTSHIPVILLTAIQQDDIKMRSLELGADDYLTKPFSHKELILRIQNILNRQQQLQDSFKRDLLPEIQEVRLNRFDSEFLERVNKYIEINLSNTKYSVEDLSSDVAISRVHLFRKMKSLLDISPSKYLRDYRLTKAAEILSREDIRILDLCEVVGFEDSNYFIKCFKEKYGISPYKYSRKGSST